MFHAISTPNGVSNEHSTILTEAISKARLLHFSTILDASPDRELPHHLADLGVVLWMSKDVQGWSALIHEIK